MCLWQKWIFKYASFKICCMLLMFQRTYTFAFLLSSRLFIQPHQLLNQVCQVHLQVFCCEFPSTVPLVSFACKQQGINDLDWYRYTPIESQDNFDIDKHLLRVFCPNKT